MEERMMEINVTVNRRTLFPRPVPFERLLLDGMNYGVRRNGEFHAGTAAADHVFAYNENRIARGIAIRWNPQEISYTGLSLKLPTSSEEMEDFFLMVAHLARQDICEVAFNGEPFLPKMFHKTKEQMQIYNLRLLHDLMGQILNEEIPFCRFDCVFYPIHAGKQEAEYMWAGISTDAFRNWMDECQRPYAYYAEENFEAAGDSAALTIPCGRQVIVPRASDTLQVRLIDPETEKTIGILPLSGFLAGYALDEVSRFDETHVGVRAPEISEIPRRFPQMEKQ